MGYRAKQSSQKMKHKCLRNTKKCSTSSAIREMPTKISLRFSLTLVRMTKRGEKDSTCWRLCRDYPLLVGEQTGTATMETVWRFLEMLGIDLS